MSAAVIILSWNARDEVRACLRSLLAQVRPAQQILVVDNGSHDGSATMVAHEFPSVHLIRNPQNLGFSRGMNIGLRILQAQATPPEVAVLLNQDALVAPDWLAALLAPFAEPTVGAVGSQISYPDGRLQHVGVTILLPTLEVRHQRDTAIAERNEQPDALTGAALGLRMAALAEVGLLDEGYSPAYYEDIDLCWRLRRAGYRLHYAAAAQVIHHESLSTRDDVRRAALYHRGRLRFALKSLPAAEFCGPFALAEAALIASLARSPEGRALRWAYGAIAATWAESFAARAAFQPEPTVASTAVAQAIIALRAQISACQHEQALQIAQSLTISA